MPRKRKLPTAVEYRIAVQKTRLEKELAELLYACKQSGTDCSSIRACIGSACRQLGARAATLPSQLAGPVSVGPPDHS